jgi:hypothetical protein
MVNKNSNKSVEPINYPAGKLLAHFKRYATQYAQDKIENTPL